MLRKYSFILLSILFIIILLISASFTGCIDQVSDHDSQDVAPARFSVAEQEVVKSAGTFGFKIFDNIGQSDSESNIFISPLSISMALGMTLNGAAGDTYNAIQYTLGLDGLSEEERNSAYKNLITTLYRQDDKINFSVANSIWYKDNYSFIPEFLQTNMEYFDAVVQGVNFRDPATLDLINNWVKEKTNYRIDKIINQFPLHTVMALLNALYFQGTWQTEFNPDNTMDDLFNLGNNNYTACRMMNRQDKYSYFENDLFQAIDLPYGDGKFSMALFLPRDDDQLSELISQMNPANWNEWMNSFEEKELIFSMPKFKLEYDTELNSVLSKLGMGIAFYADLADFTRMYAPGNIFISKVIHKANIEVNEEGTEAAAATAVIIVERSAPTLPSMHVNKPFVFVIHEKDSGALLFMGRVNNPVN